MNGKQLGVLVCGIGATLTGLGAVGYHLFAPQISEGTTCPLNEPDTCQQALAAHSTGTTSSFVQLSFSVGWLIFFSVLALAIIGISLCATQFARTQYRLWAWILAALTLFYITTMYLLVDTTAFHIGQESGIGGNLAQNAYFGPGAVLALLAVVLAFVPSGSRASHAAAATN